MGCGDLEVASDRQVDEGGRPRHAFAMRSHAAMLGICVVAWCGVARGADAPPWQDTARPPGFDRHAGAPEPAAVSGGARRRPGADQIQFAAREHDLGYRAYLNKQYDEAASHFENAFFAAPTPAELRSAVRARHDAGELARAATLAAIGQRRFPSDAATSKVAADAIAQARPHQVYEVQLASSAEYSVAIDEKIVVAERSKESRIFVNPGAHQLLVSWSDDRNTRIAIDAQEGGSQSLQLEPPGLARVEAPPAARSHAGPWPRRSGAGPPVTVPLAVARPSRRLHRNPLVRLYSSRGLRSRPLAPGSLCGRVSTPVELIRGPITRRDAACGAGQSADCTNLYQTGRDAQSRTNVLIGVTSGVAAVTAIVGLFFTQWSPAVATVGTHAAPAPVLVPVLGLGHAGLEGTF